MVAANIETGALRAERFKQKPHRFLGKPIVQNVANKKHCIRRLLQDGGNQLILAFPVKRAVQISDNGKAHGAAQLFGGKHITLHGKLL